MNHFQNEIQSPEYLNLRMEYEDAELLHHVRNFDKNPDSFYDAALAYNVPLQSPGEGFTMRELLTVLKAAQDAHEKKRETLKSRFSPSESPAAPRQAAESEPRTVNGTAERRNAAPTTISNDLASTRASSAPTRRTLKDRVKAEIERLHKAR